MEATTRASVFGAAGKPKAEDSLSLKPHAFQRNDLAPATSDTNSALAATGALATPAAAASRTRLTNDYLEPTSFPAAQVSWQSEVSPTDANQAELVAPAAPAKNQYIRFPSTDPKEAAKVRITGTNERISLTARDASMSVVLGIIAEQHGLNIVSGEEVSQRISVTLKDVDLNDALDAILGVNGYAWSREKNILSISSLSAEKKSSASIQGRQLRVFSLNYITAADADKVVTGLLSPVGQSFMHQTSVNDQRRTHEQIVVEDLPYYVRRVEEYLQQVDIPPRQVIVEAHVLQITLRDDCKHGVNIRQILRLANANIALEAAGFANPAALPASFLRIDGTDLDALIEFVKSTTDAKTLASPKVAVLNGQEAHLQIGSKLGFLLTTTTQTSTLQSVNFLDVGVILKVTPQITDDGQVLMQVKPQVSNGRINPVTSLPESETTEVDTKIMLADGEALIIGGLIKESDTNVQTKIPYLGDAWLIGRLFQRRSVIRERNEVIIALVPRIVPNVPGCRADNPVQVDQARTPLLHGPLERVDRTMWEPELPDASERRHGRVVVQSDVRQMPEEVVVPPPARSIPTPARDPLPEPAVKLIPSNPGDEEDAVQKSSFETPERPQPSPLPRFPAPRRLPPV